MDPSFLNGVPRVVLRVESICRDAFFLCESHAIGMALSDWVERVFFCGGRKGLFRSFVLAGFEGAAGWRVPLF
jgi:hypothetical protein